MTTNPITELKVNKRDAAEIKRAVVGIRTSLEKADATFDVIGCVLLGRLLDMAENEATTVLGNIYNADASAGRA